MTHLFYHLVDGLHMCESIATRWMYLVGRYMKILKLYVRNMARLEASMAKGYILMNARVCYRVFTEV
jgi:hypothetical protein